MESAVVIELYVTNLEKEGQLLKVWGQRDHAAATNVERLIEQNHEQFERGLGVPDPHSLRPDQLYCAPYSDGRYYRARIVQVDLTSGTASCIFVDYGNRGNVFVQNLRIPENRQALFSLPAQASSFILAEAVGSWDQPALDWVLDKIGYETLKGVILKNTGYQNQISLLKLFFEGRDLVELLATWNMATRIPIQQFEVMMWTSQSAPQAGQIPTVQTPMPLTMNTNQNMYMMQMLMQNMMQNMNMMPNTMVSPPVASPSPVICPISNPMPSAAPKSAQTAPVPALTRFSTINLESNLDHRVVVSYVERGTFSFAVQPQSCFKERDTLMAALNSPAIAYSHLKPPYVPGTICLGKSQDGTIYRAVVTGIDSEKCIVYYVDYGNCETLSCKDLYEIPSKYTHPKVMALQFTLAGLRDVNCTDEMKEIFGDLVSEKEAILRVVQPKCEELYAKQLCDLFLNNTNVKELINIALMKKPKNQSKLGYRNVEFPEAGSKVKVVVAYVKGLDNFYVQLAAKQKDLESVMDEVSEYCNGSAGKFSVAQVHLGAVCCALYSEDDQWYRAVVLNADPNDLTVLYVDYGNEEKVAVDNLKVANANLVNKLKAQAIPCRLSGFDGRDDKELISRFEELALENTFVMHVDQLIREVPCVSVRLIDESGTDIAKLLDASPSKAVNGFGSNSNSSPSQNLQVNGKNGWDHSSDSKHSEMSPSKNRNERDRESRDRFTGSSDRGHGDRDSRGRVGDSSDRGVERKHERNYRETQPSRMAENKSYRGRDREEDASQEVYCPKKDPEAWGIGKSSGGTSSAYGHCDRDGVDSLQERGGRGGYKGQDSSYSKSDSASPQKFNRSSRDYHRESEDSFKSSKATSEETWDDSNSSPALTISELTIPLNIKKPVFLVYSNSPNDFYLQERSSDDSLQNLMDQIADRYSEGGDALPNSSLSVGTVCVAKYSEDDTWYRGVVQKVTTSSVDVLFPDYGNTQTVDCKDLKAITADLVGLPRQAIHCMLMGVPSTGWSDDQLDAFGKLLDSESLEAEFVDKKDNIFRVVLMDPTTNSTVNESFGATVESLTSPTAIVTNVNRQELVLGSTHEILIGWFVNPERFYIQLKSSEEEFKSMMGKVQNDYKHKNALPNVTIGHMAVARFKSDGALYRCQVKMQRGDNYGVYYIDYGNKSLVDSKSIYGLEYQYSHIPCQAIQCSLKGVLPLDGVWPKENAEINKCFQGNLTCTIHGETTPTSDGEVSYIVTVSRNGQDLTQELIEKQLVREDVAPCAPEELEDSSDDPVEKQLLVGQLVPAFVEHVEETRLFVTFEKDSLATKREEFKQIIQQAENLVHLPSEKAIPGQLCLALSEVSQLNERAVIVDSKSTAGITVQLLDYGRSEEVPCDKVLVLPEELESIPALLSECEVSNIQSDTDLLSLQQQNVILAVNSYKDNKLQVEVLDARGRSLPFAPSDRVINSLLPMPIIRRKMRVTVSHASGSTVWLQPICFEDLISNLLDEMFEIHDGGSESLETVMKGILCAAKSVEDDNWYRAEIESELAEEGIITVRYLDYGNSESLPLTNLKVLNEKFLSIHALAVKASLPIISEDVTLGETILEKASDKTFKAVFVKESGNWFTELVDGKLDLSMDLILTGKALTMPNNPFPALLVEPESDVVLSVGGPYNVCVSYVESPSEFYVQLEPDSIRLEKIQDHLQTVSHCMKTCEKFPKVGSMCMALYAEDDVWYRGLVMPDQSIFFIDYGNSEKVELSNLKVLPPALEQMKSFAVKCSLEAPVNKRWSETTSDRLTELVSDQGPVFLTVVSELKDTKVVTLSMPSIGNIADLLIECGCLEDLKANDLEEVKVFVTSVTSPSDFMVRNAFNNSELRCTLYLPSHVSDWSEAAVAHFKDLVADGSTEFVMNTLIEDTITTVSLTCSGRKVDDELLALCNKEMSATMKAAVVFINSPANFYVHPTKDNEAIEKMAQDLMEAGSFGVCEDTSKDAFCAALFPSDDLWYRAKIIGEESGGFDVLFIDYGNTAVTTELRALPEHLKKLPPLALHCTLATPDGMSGWPDCAIEKFEELSADGETEFELEILSSGEPLVANLKCGDLNVAQELSKMSGNVPGEGIGISDSDQGKTKSSSDGEDREQEILPNTASADHVSTSEEKADCINAAGSIVSVEKAIDSDVGEVSQSGISEEEESTQIETNSIALKTHVPVEACSTVGEDVEVKSVIQETSVQDTAFVNGVEADSSNATDGNAPDCLEESVVELGPILQEIPVITIDDSSEVMSELEALHISEELSDSLEKELVVSSSPFHENIAEIPGRFSELTLTAETCSDVDPSPVDIEQGKQDDITSDLVACESTVVPSSKMEDVVVSLTTYPSAKLCESDIGGSSQGQCKAESSEFRSELENSIPGVVTYRFQDCEVHSKSIDVESTNENETTSS